MNETLLEPPPTDPPPADPPPAAPPPPTGPPRLVRDPADRVIAGVCAGLGRSTGTDPVLWRVTLVVLALFGGTGLLLYLLAWVLVPRAGAPESFVERLVRGGAVPAATAAVLAVLTVCTLVAVADDGAAVFALVVIGGLAALVARQRRNGPPVPPAPADAWPQPVAAVPRERSPLGLLTCSAAVLAVGLLLLAGELGASWVTPPRVLSVALLVVGAGLLVGTWYGRARWLVVPGLLLAVAAVASSAVQGPYGWDAGERTWTPAVDAQSSYRLGLGEATLDLRGLAPGELPRVEATLGAGHLVVLVPDDLPVLLRTSVQAGEVVRRDAAGQQTAGDPPGGPSGPPTELDLSVRVGQIEVRRVAA